MGLPGSFIKGIELGISKIANYKDSLIVISKRRAMVGSIQKCWAFWTGLDESTASPGRATSVLSTTWEGINRLLSADQLVNLSGLVTNSNLFCRLFKIKDWCKKVRFQQMHNHD